MSPDPDGADGSDEPPRVLSLLSAATEIICRLGCSHLLVGRSHGCDDPLLVSALPIATAPRVDPNASSSELDAQVRVQSATGGPVYKIDGDLVREARPTVIVTQEQCRICAVTPADLDSACDLSAHRAKVVTIMPVSLEDVIEDVRSIAEGLGVPERGERLAAHLRRQFAGIASTAADVSGGRPRPTVAHVEWLAPLMGSGYWIAECVEIAGGEMVHGRAGGHSRVLEKIELLSDADYIVLAPCGFTIERTREELRTVGLLESQEWENLPAVRNGRVAVADGNKYFNRSSVASIQGTAEMVAEMIHPELRGMYGHHGTRWVRIGELDAFCERKGAEPVRKEVALAPSDRPEPAAAAEIDKSTNGSRQPPSPSTERSDPAIDHVARQIDSLRRGDYAAAFGLNSPANRKRLTSAEQFQAIVTGWTSFRTLTLPGTECAYLRDAGAEEGAGARASVSVDAVAEGAGAALAFVFDLRRSEDGERWETDGVRIKC